MTSQKTEKKRISSKIFVALAALTLVSCCFLGTTFARYTTGTTSGSAGADIADWEIVVEGPSSGTGTGEFLVISPDQDAYNEDTNSTDPRVTEITGSGTVVKITNNGQVDAKVKVSVGSTQTYWVKDYQMNGAQVVIENGKYVWTEAPLVDDDGQTTYHDQQGREYRWDSTKMAPEYQTSPGVWEVPDEWNGASNDGKVGIAAILSVGGLSSSVAAGQDGYISLASGKSITLTVGSASWTTDFTGDTQITNPSYSAEPLMPGDLRDTWIGENLSKVGYTFTWEAIQDSQIPAAN